MATQAPQSPRPTRLGRDVVAGLFVIAVAAAGHLGASDLAVSESSGVGPGFMPKGVALLIAAFGMLITVLGLTASREPLGRWSLRGPLFVLGSVAVFAASIRPLGLAIAGPLAVIIAALADKDSRVVEILLFAVVMSAFSIGLFKYLLRLPVPLAPMLLGY